MPSFSSLIGVAVTDPRTVAPYLGMIPSSPDFPRTYKPCTLLKPSKTSKDQRWLLIWWQYSPQDGKVIRRRQGLDLGSYPSLKDREKRAGEWIAAINTLLKAGYVYGQEEQTQLAPNITSSWEEVWGRFVTLHQHYSTFRLQAYNSIRLVWKNWVAETRSTPATLHPEEGKKFTRYLDGLLSKKGTPYNPVTLNHYQSTLKHFGKWCGEEGYLREDQLPFFLYKKRKEAKSSLHKPFNQVQLAQVLAKARSNPQLYLFLHLCYYTFARPRRELTKLRIQDIEENTIYIIPAHDKNRVGRRVLLPHVLQELLTSYKVKEYPPHLYLFSKKGVPGPKPVGHDYFYQLLKGILEELGLAGNNHTLYSLKASGNIALWQATQNLDLLRRQNGHSSLQMTERYLRHLGVILNQDQLLDFPRMGQVD